MRRNNIFSVRQTFGSSTCSADFEQTLVSGFKKIVRRSFFGNSGVCSLVCLAIESTDSNTRKQSWTNAIRFWSRLGNLTRQHCSSLLILVALLIMLSSAAFFFGTNSPSFVCAEHSVKHPFSRSDTRTQCHSAFSWVFVPGMVNNRWEACECHTAIFWLCSEMLSGQTCKRRGVIRKVEEEVLTQGVCCR